MGLLQSEEKVVNAEAFLHEVWDLFLFHRGKMKTSIIVSLLGNVSFRKKKGQSELAPTTAQMDGVCVNTKRFPLHYCSRANPPSYILIATQCWLVPSLEC
jgi:hypothetical protein